MNKLGRSWALFNYSIWVLKKDKELFFYPIISLIVAITFCFFATLLVYSITFIVFVNYEMLAGIIIYCGTAVMFFVTGFIITFFNASLIAAILLRINGKNPNLKDGIKAASKFKWQIFKYTLLNMTVGLIIQFISSIFNKIPILSYLVHALGITVWSITNYFSLPLLVTRSDLEPFEVVTESAKILKQTWGETLIHNVGLGFTFLILYFLYGSVVFLSIPLFNIENALPLIIIFFALFILLVVLQTALGAVLRACLFQYALDNNQNLEASPFGNDPQIVKIFRNGFNKG